VEKIHPTAIVSSRAQLGSGVEIGPYVIIEGEVTLGDGTVVDHHATIYGETVIGPGCRIYPYAFVGTDPQDMKYQGGTDSRLEIGAGTRIREYATVSRGTPGGGGVTVIGRQCFLMAYVHVAHDCRLGDGIIMANAATLGGHIDIGDRAIIGGLTAIHQFCRVGRSAIVSGTAGVNQDVPPYCLAAGAPARLYSLNLVGLKRQGYGEETIAALKKAFRLLFRTDGLNLKDAIVKVREELPALPEIEHLLEFIEQSSRGICRKP